MSCQSATVLCIDDEDDGLKVRKMLLEAAGYRVLLARSGREGIEVFRSQPQIDAVILDYWMSGMNGMVVARELKRISPNTPIMILSAYGTLLDETLGVVDLWVRKGEEDPEYLLGRLRELLADREWRHREKASTAQS